MSAPGIVVGVCDEPELVVSGVGAMLARSDIGAVRALRATDGLAAGVDVVLCDPIGRTPSIEDYVARVAEVTSAPLLAFVWASGPASVRRCLDAGAGGVVSKTTSADDLADAVRAVVRGEAVARPVLPQSLDRAGLSQREADVLELICRGLSNAEIADELFVSVNSVKTYIRQVYQKVGVARRSQAVAWGLAHGF